MLLEKTHAKNVIYSKEKSKLAIMRKRNYILEKAMMYIYKMPNELGTVLQRTKREKKKIPGNIMDSHLICKKHFRILNCLFP